jgi:hypothetical protein
MHPVHDVDAMLILSLALAAKRRPADLVEIVTAAALTQGAIPAAPLLSDAFARLSACGLVVGSDDGYTLSADGQQMLAGQRNKDDNARKLSRIMEHLAGYKCKGEHPALQVSKEQLHIAAREYRANSNSPGKSLLTSKPKPKPVWIPKKDLVQGKQHLSSKRRKTKAP